jgi:hypothetical protein
VTGSNTIVSNVRIQPIKITNLSLDKSLVEFDPDCEAMIFATDGTPLQGHSFLHTEFGRPTLSLLHFTGITGGFGGDRRVEYIVPPAARAQGRHDFVIESSCNGMFGVPWDGDTISPPDVCLVQISFGLLIHGTMGVDEQALQVELCGSRRS